MAQGKTKGLQAKSGPSARQVSKAAAATKKGKRYIAPKKTVLVKQAAMHKVFQVPLLPGVFTDALLL